METLWRKLMLVSTILPQSYHNYHQFVNKPEPDNSIIVNIKQCCPQIISKISNTAIVIRLKHRTIALNDESVTYLCIELLGQQKSQWKNFEWKLCDWFDLEAPGFYGFYRVRSFRDICLGKMGTPIGQGAQWEKYLMRITIDSKDFSGAKLRNTKLCFGQKQCSGFFC